MTQANPKAAFFDGIADKWDGWEDLPSLARKLAAGFAELEVAPDETVMDVGCGTGNLTKALLAHLSPQGRVIAIDISPRMLEAAKAKVPDPRASWHMASAQHLPLADACCDRVLCFSVWPHFDDRPAAIRELTRVLRPGGKLHIWHLISRQKVNEIHDNAGEAVRGDVLEPANVTASLLTSQGLRVSTCVDTDSTYLVTATKA